MNYLKKIYCFKILVITLLTFTTNISLANCNLIDKEAAKIMQKNGINGMAVAIIDNNKTQFCNYGYINSNHNQKVNQHTIFEIASISKTFTATLAGIASAENKLNLQTSINNYVPNLNNQVYNTINSQELLTHVSGLDFTQETNFKQFDLNIFMDTLNKTKAKSPPQTYYSYGQVGISIVALALENIYHDNFNNILHKTLLNNLNMDETFVKVPSNYKNIAVGYNQNNQALPPFNIGLLTPAGGLKSSTNDLTKYLQLQLNQNKDPIISKALTLVHQNYYCLYSDGTMQQLAWVYHPAQDLTSLFTINPNYKIRKPQKLATNCTNSVNGFIEKSGNSLGMSSYIIYMPSTNSGVVVLTNKAQVADTINLGRAILNKYFHK